MFAERWGGGAIGVAQPCHCLARPENRARLADASRAGLVECPTDAVVLASQGLARHGRVSDDGTGVDLVITVVDPVDPRRFARSWQENSRNQPDHSCDGGDAPPPREP